MPTWTALAVAPERAAAEALGAALEALSPAPTGVGVFEIEDGSGLWEVGGYFQAPPDGLALDLLSAAWGARPFVVSKLPERDWVAAVRRELSPVRAGRFVVYGEHDADRISPHLIGLRIEAAMAFGTGHHATTQGCLIALDRLSRRMTPPRRVADVGCGTGVLAMAAAKLWRRPATASDIDPVATATARANARANRMGPLVRVACAPGFRTPALREGPPFDLIFANILARPLARLAPDMARRAAPGGRVILSGILDRQAPATEAVYRAWGFRLEDRVRLAGWTALTLRRT
ncbi:MAG: 50S ribosomal protein L11 methyltransferase [Rhodobacteraceae bacterium]|nr:MAG: 50S ribosomal protein L11 methyltransferase [Paracoccaceae bacterium]